MTCYDRLLVNIGKPCELLDKVINSKTMYMEWHTTELAMGSVVLGTFSIPFSSNCQSTAPATRMWSLYTITQYIFHICVYLAVSNCKNIYTSTSQGFHYYYYQQEHVLLSFQAHSFKIGRSRYPTASAWAVGLNIGYSHPHNLRYFSSFKWQSYTLLGVLGGWFGYIRMPGFSTNPNGKSWIHPNKHQWNSSLVLTCQGVELVQTQVIPSPSFRDCLPISTWPVENGSKWGNSTYTAAFEGKHEETRWWPMIKNDEGIKHFEMKAWWKHYKTLEVCVQCG